MAGVATPRDGGPADPGRLAALEDELGVALPPEYRTFLAAHDGVALAPNRMDPARNKTGVSGEARTLYGVGELREQRRLSGTRMPAELLPIGDAEGGNLIALGVAGDVRGRVLYWDHEWEASDGEPPTWENLTELAPTFAAWYDALVPFADEEDGPVEGTGRINPGFLERMRREGRI